ncbi:substrate-binding periplasmic protein [Paludibacterium paludis]|uniref:Polar amino acid ABC transporter n=1 Tax=Paludibacterium paludis TaxID=1225769 RepID=A0A918U6C9_9NEIS|nr:transporter substrate-binding domain-containing protein [Paludibacterium paludis]GGY02398.1 polar amino acid ABC transporter [Paludibacterium paludis]
MRFISALLRATLQAGLLLLVASSLSRADNTVHIAFGETLAPYVIEETQSGLELEIVRAALKEEGLALKPSFYPQKRLPVLLGSSQVDGVALMTAALAPHAALSEVYVTYEDYAITLARRGITLHSISDMKPYTVAGFPLASHYFGAEYLALASNNPNYSEPSNQMDQNRLLYREAVDVVIADKRIFHYYDRQLIRQKLEKPADVTLHPLFDQVSYRIAFRDKALRDRFNRGLAAIAKKGIYRTISQRYP